MILSVNELNNEDFHLTLFPNPTNGLITIEINSTSQSAIEIYDLTGRLVLKESFFDTMHSIYLKEAPGIYMVRLTINNQVYARKIQLK